MLLATAFFLVVTCNCAFSARIAHGAARLDRIKHLPGLKKMPSFRMYSGYLTAKKNNHLHYWLNEKLDKSTDRLIVWFNGGPGCSSLTGLFQENGPVMFTLYGDVVENPYSWNKLAATLYIEMPVNVGYSYSTNKDVEYSDDSVTSDTYNGLKHFFEKFPAYKKSEIYIAGESYAGVYIPNLAVAIMDGDAEWRSNLKGLLIGNGVLNKELNDASMLYFAYYHSFIGTDLWEDLQENCCLGGPGICTFKSPPIGRHVQCKDLKDKARDAIYHEGLNIYNIYQDCTHHDDNKSSSNYDTDGDTAYGDYKDTYDGDYKDTYDGDYNDTYGGDYNDTYDGDYANEDYAKDADGDEDPDLIPTCLNGTVIRGYLNREDVKSALHILDSKTWGECHKAVFNDYIRQDTDMTDDIQRVLDETDARILLYYGDNDLACNALGGEWFFDRLGYELITPWRLWKVENKHGVQIAGYYEEKPGIHYVTIKGAGHMVPTDKPFEMMELLKRYFDGTML